MMITGIDPGMVAVVPGMGVIPMAVMAVIPMEVMVVTRMVATAVIPMAGILKPGTQIRQQQLAQPHRLNRQPRHRHIRLIQHTMDIEFGIMS